MEKKEMILTYWNVLKPEKMKQGRKIKSQLLSLKTAEEVL